MQPPQLCKILPSSAFAQPLRPPPDELPTIAADEDFWFEVRHAFSIDRSMINLNNGSVCPSPQVVQRAMEDQLRMMNMQPSYYVDEMAPAGGHVWL